MLTKIGLIVGPPVAVGVVAEAGLVLAQLGPDPMTAAGQTGVGIVAGTVVAAAITAIGNSLWQPWIKEKRTQEKLDEALKQIEESKSRIANLEEVNRQERARVLQVEKERQEVMLNTARVMEKTAIIIERNATLSRNFLVAAGKIAPSPLPVPSLTIGGPEAPPGPRVLLVEDDAKTRLAMATILELQKYQVVPVDGVMEAMQRLDEQQFDAVVLDLMLPDGDGAEVLRRVRESGLKTKVIVQTGKDSGQLKPVIDLRPDAILSKPFDFTTQLLPVMPPILKAPEGS